MTEPTSNAERKRDAARRTANGVFQAWEKRTELVKNETAATNAAMDAKTIRLKALRLEKEKLDAEAAAAAAAATPTPVKKTATKIRRIVS